MMDILLTYEQGIEATEIWSYRRILRIKWTEHVSNKEALRKMGIIRHLYSESGRDTWNLLFIHKYWKQEKQKKTSSKLHNEIV